MNEVFKAALSLSCSGALLILTICLLRPLIRKRLSQRWQYYIWLVVILRLLLPFTSETNLVGSIFRQIGHEISQAEHAPRPYKAPERSEILISPSQDATAENGSHMISGAIESTRYMQVRAVMGEYICIIWLVITLVLFIRKITIYQGFVKYIRAGCAEVEEI